MPRTCYGCPWATGSGHAGPAGKAADDCPWQAAPATARRAQACTSSPGALPACSGLPARSSEPHTGHLVPLHLKPCSALAWKEAPNLWHFQHGERDGVVEGFCRPWRQMQCAAARSCLHLDCLRGGPQNTPGVECTTRGLGRCQVRSLKENQPTAQAQLSRPSAAGSPTRMELLALSPHHRRVRETGMGRGDSQ